MKYTLIKRKKSFRTKSETEFVSWMKNMDHQKWIDNRDFMEGYSYRKATFENILIRYDNEQNFIEDLQKNNLLKIESSKGFLGLFNLSKLVNSRIFNRIKRIENCINFFYDIISRWLTEIITITGIGWPVIFRGDSQRFRIQISESFLFF